MAAEEKAAIRSVLERYIYQSPAIQTGELSPFVIASPLKVRKRSYVVVRKRFVQVLVAMLVISTPGMGLIYASDNALPDEGLLYSVKTGIERVQTMFAFSADAKAEVSLSVTEKRLHEVAQMAAAERLSPYFERQLAAEIEGEARNTLALAGEIEKKAPTKALEITEKLEKTLAVNQKVITNVGKSAKSTEKVLAATEKVREETAATKQTNEGAIDTKTLASVQQTSVRGSIDELNKIKSELIARIGNDLTTQEVPGVTAPESALVAATVAVDSPMTASLVAREEITEDLQGEVASISEEEAVAGEVSVTPEAVVETKPEVDFGAMVNSINVAITNAQALTKSGNHAGALSVLREVIHDTEATLESLRLDESTQSE